MASLSMMSLLADSKYKQLTEMYGGSASSWRYAGAATLIGADIAEGYAKWANASLEAAQLETRQHEINSRADATITSLLKQGEQVVGKQAAAFVKSGVKLEGSALNVMTETIEQANESARIARMESDFQNSQIEVQKALAKTKASMAPFETALNIGSSLVSSGVFNQPSSSSFTAPNAFSNQQQMRLQNFDRFRSG